MIDTIVAPATPLGRSALAIVRIDGPLAPRILEDLAGRPLEERRATRVRLASETGLVDEAVATRWVAPHSFTGNDLVEISLHGSIPVVERLLREVLARGARMAEAGEFTERAVLNGKIDLVQAEAIGDLVNARTGVQAKLALANLEGALSREAAVLRERIVELLSRFEAALDFADEGYTFVERDEAIDLAEGAIEAVDRLAATFARGRSTASGVTAVILGRPNVGKSTLLNFLCGSERAIVTPVAGTTRDLLRETVEIGGLPVTVVDTAGLRSTSDLVEEIGVARAIEAASAADLVMYLVDATAGLDPEEDAVLARHPEAIVVYTKVDLAEAPAGALGISIPAGRGEGELLARLDRVVRERYAVPEGSAAVVNERQRAALEEGREALAAAREAMRAGATEEFVAADLRRAARALGALTGEVTSGEVLARIFAKFCIGK
ncbi:MAG: tRNA uridine-5-carboxymethylaminomethyl(34) synthesis GTPase MnmE [Thermoanaerobaculia bacterium]